MIGLELVLRPLVPELLCHSLKEKSFFKAVITRFRSCTSSPASCSIPAQKSGGVPPLPMSRSQRCRKCSYAMTLATNLGDTNPPIATMIGSSASHCLSHSLPLHPPHRVLLDLVLALVPDRLVQQEELD